MPLSAGIEKKILQSLNQAVRLLEKCRQAASLQEKSLLSENIDSFCAQARISRSAAEDASVFLKTACALENDMTGDGRIVISPEFRELAGNLRERISVLSDECSFLSLELTKKGEKLMKRYSGRISGISNTRKNNTPTEVSVSFNNSPEMIDITV